MSHEIRIPSVGESITTATIAKWHKEDGDAVTSGDTLLTFDTDKVSTDLQAEKSGILQIAVPVGEEVPIGAVVARIEEFAQAQGAPVPIQQGAIGEATGSDQNSGPPRMVAHHDLGIIPPVVASLDCLRDTPRAIEMIRDAVQRCPGRRPLHLQFRLRDGREVTFALGDSHRVSDAFTLEPELRRWLPE